MSFLSACIAVSNNYVNDSDHEIMKQFLKTIKKSYRATSLTAVERSAVRDAVVSFMHEHPVRADVARRQVWHTGDALRLIMHFLKPMPIALLIFLLLGGGVSYAAENALPGDILYPVKVQVNEPVRELLTIDKKDKAGLATQLVERRLQEAEALSARGALNDNNRASIEVAFTKQSTTASSRIREFETSGDIDTAASLASSLEGSLKAHEKILREVAPRATGQTFFDDSKSFESLKKKLSDVSDDTSMFRIKLEQSLASSTATSTQAGLFAPTRVAATAAIRTVRSFIEKNNARLDPATVTTATQQLNQADALVLQGDTFVTERKFVDAFRAFQKAGRIAREARILLVASRELPRVIKPNDSFDDDASDDHGQDSDRDEHATSTPRVGLPDLNRNTNVNRSDDDGNDDNRGVRVTSTDSSIHSNVNREDTSDRGRGRSGNDNRNGNGNVNINSSGSIEVEAD